MLLDDNVVKYIILFHPQTQKNRITVPQLHLLDDIKFFQISIFDQFTGQNMHQRDKNSGILF